MKVNEAPEKLYILHHEDYLDRRIFNAFTEKESNTDIEYIRKDAFIEKVCEWLEPVLKDYAGYYVGEDILEGFKKYVEGE